MHTHGELLQIVVGHVMDGILGVMIQLGGGISRFGRDHTRPMGDGVCVDFLFSVIICVVF